MSFILEKFGKKRNEVLAWSMYDFGNQPFTTLIVTFIFSAFFTEVLAEDNQIGTSLWSIGISITAVLVAFSSPILGAFAACRNAPFAHISNDN